MVVYEKKTRNQVLYNWLNRGKCPLFHDNGLWEVEKKFPSSILLSKMNICHSFVWKRAQKGYYMAVEHLTKKPNRWVAELETENLRHSKKCLFLRVNNRAVTTFFAPKALAVKGLTRNHVSLGMLYPRKQGWTWIGGDLDSPLTAHFLERGRVSKNWEAMIMT